MPELRRDPITGEWVIIASERAKRPSDFAARPQGADTDDAARCPFCPGNESMTPPEIIAFRHPGSQRNGPGWCQTTTRGLHVTGGRRKHRRGG